MGGSPVANGSVFRLLVGLIIATPLAFFFLSVAFGPVALAIVVHLNLFGNMPHGGFGGGGASMLEAANPTFQGLVEIAADFTESFQSLKSNDMQSLVGPMFDEDGLTESSPIPNPLLAAEHAGPAPGPAAYQRKGGPFNLIPEHDYFGKDIRHMHANSPNECGKICMQNAAPEKGGCGYFTFRDTDGHCYIKPLKDKRGKMIKINLKKSVQHVAGDIKSMLQKKCDGNCWNRMRTWMVVTMFIGMLLAIILIACVVHDLDLLRLRKVAQPEKQRNWLTPYNIQGDYVARMSTTGNVIFTLLLLGWFILGSVWTWACACSSCHHTVLWKALNAYLIAVWMAGLVAWVLMIIMALFTPQRPIEDDKGNVAVAPAPLEKIEVVPAYYPQYKQAHPVVHRWSQYY